MGKRSVLNRVNVFFHSKVFSLINSNSVIVDFLYSNKVIGQFFTIDSKLTFKRNFPVNRPFSFIQIGGNDGVSFDFLYTEVTIRESSGLIIEPSPKYFKELEHNYRNFVNIKLVNKAIFKSNKKVKLFEVNEKGLKKLPDWAKGVGSFDKDHLMRNNLNEKDIDVWEVEGITFMDLLNNSPEFLSVDYLQIDTEGFDFEILKLIDFSKFKCDFIKYEIANLKNDELKNSLKLLSDQGYRIVGDQYDNYCFKNQYYFSLKFNKKK